MNGRRTRDAFLAEHLRVVDGRLAAVGIVHGPSFTDEVSSVAFEEAFDDRLPCFLVYDIVSTDVSLYANRYEKMLYVREPMQW